MMRSALSGVCAFVVTWLLSGCGSKTDPLTKGYAWISHAAPATLAPGVSHYEHFQMFGLGRDPNGWRATTRYTLKRDVADPLAGCSFIEWIPGTWTSHDSTLVVTTPRRDSGSLEVYNCPDGSQPRTLPRPPHFIHAESTFRLEGTTLHLDRQFGDGPQPPLELVQEPPT
ncbi:MAG: hypothetical protein IPK60_13700 [Sandaracinaceae bacterium]|nr:hypothetical protein [Sandaracinaceae bacterium]